MNNKYRYQKKSSLSEINVVPYIDVMLVLLVIFMITAPMLSQGIEVKLPQTESSQLSSPQEPIIVSLDKKGGVFLNIAENPHTPLNTTLILNKVAATLALAKQRGEKKPVFVKGDEDVNYGEIVKIMALLQKAGAEEVGLMTQPQLTDNR
jgi:biopolymer transport protein TolR